MTSNSFYHCKARGPFDCPILISHFFEILILYLKESIPKKNNNKYLLSHLFVRFFSLNFMFLLYASWNLKKNRSVQFFSPAVCIKYAAKGTNSKPGKKISKIKINLFNYNSILSFCASGNSEGSSLVFKYESTTSLINRLLIILL